MRAPPPLSKTVKRKRRSRYRPKRVARVREKHLSYGKKAFGMIERKRVGAFRTFETSSGGLLAVMPYGEGIIPFLNPAKWIDTKREQIPRGHRKVFKVRTREINGERKTLVIKPIFPISSRAGERMPDGSVKRGVAKTFPTKEARNLDYAIRHMPMYKFEKPYAIYFSPAGKRYVIMEDLPGRMPAWIEPQQRYGIQSDFIASGVDPVDLLGEGANVGKQMLVVPKTTAGKDLIIRDGKPVNQDYDLYIVDAEYWDVMRRVNKRGRQVQK